MREIRDNDPKTPVSYFSLVFRRGERVQEITLSDWIVLTVIEIFFGAEILEQLIITSAYNEGKIEKVGHFLHVSNLVPAGLFTNLLRKRLYQVLYYKYFKQYLFLQPESDFDEAELVQEDGSLLLNRVRFGMRHELLYQTIAFRRAYILVWICVNLVLDLLVLATADIQAAIVSAVSIEAVRRVLKL
ncbi:hypothetical protein A8C75_10150 [Marinobacterium aestuarii]|uniref:Uncharacterized protein n=1 Tax=Marinobacterium aestuarii TaxID=1821621 RepID=A0A1A9EYI9_9GAMM|nr:hypothetical protein [Marinobacterium aestuarii]ANG62810.1 hypothetical protein A8C75_10150 [Marinobacterium aestuarii]